MSNQENFYFGFLVSECAVVDDSRGNDKEIDEEMSDSDLSSSDSPDDDTDSDEDYIPYEETKAETSNKRTAKSQRQRNNKVSMGIF